MQPLHYIVLILMYRTESLIDTRNTYPAKSKPAVPRMLRAIFIAFIWIHLVSRFASGITMPLRTKRMRFKAKSLGGQRPHLYKKAFGSESRRNCRQP